MSYELCNINWKRAPAHNSIRYVLQGLDAKDVEESFRQHSLELHADSSAYGGISMDGKVLRGSFDHFEDRKAAQTLIKELGVAGQLFTLDALHTQKNN